MLSRTISTMPVTTMGRMMTVCTTDSSYFTSSFVSMYSQATGIESSSAPTMPTTASMTVTGGISTACLPPPGRRLVNCSFALDSRWTRSRDRWMPRAGNSCANSSATATSTT